tara:strand:- start:5921 stop:6313 length:393 start_codon:yes stop_codon:yes gene_type:complete
MEFTGIVHKIFDTEQISDTFKKREFIIESSVEAKDNLYTELISFQFIQSRCDLLEDIQVGQKVDIAFNLKGRKWTNPQGIDKYFNTLQAWKINVKGDTNNSNNTQPKDEPRELPPMPDFNAPVSEDEVPF